MAVHVDFAIKAKLSRSIPEKSQPSDRQWLVAPTGYTLLCAAHLDNEVNALPWGDVRVLKKRAAGGTEFTGASAHFHCLRAVGVALPPLPLRAYLTG